MADSRPLQLLENEAGRRELVTVDNICEKLKGIPSDMRLFSLSIKSLFAENATSSTSPNAARMNKLRDDLKKDAVVYMKGLLPASVTLVESINDFFEYYETNTYEQWLLELKHMLDDVTGFILSVNAVIEMHEKVMGSLKHKEDQAKLTLRQLELVTKEYRNMKTLLNASIPLQFVGALALCLYDKSLFLKHAPKLLGTCAATIAQSAANGSQALINESASLIVQDIIIPSLGNFIDSLVAIAGFFSLVKKQLSTFQKKGKHASSIEHYHKMKSKASEIILNCSNFVISIPDVKSDFLSLPETSNDSNYIDQWLENTKQEIEKKYNNEIPSSVEELISQLEKELQIHD